MIPIWLTPKVIKASIIGLIVIIIYGFGVWTASKMKESKIVKLKSDYQILLSNNQQCLDQNARAFKSIDDLESAIVSQNAAFTKLASDSAEALAKQRLKSRLALEAYQRASQQAESDYRADKEELLKRMALLTASESCHEAWKEVVK